MNPVDAQRLGVTGEDSVQIRSRRGSLVASVLIAPTVSVGQVYLPMHYPEVNQLNCASLDPHSRQPSYKYCAVQIERVVTGQI